MAQPKVRLANRLLLTYTMLIGISALMLTYASYELFYSSRGIHTYFSVAELVLLVVISVILTVEFLVGFRRDLVRLRAIRQ